MCAFICYMEGIGREIGLVFEIFLRCSSRIWNLQPKVNLFECNNFQKIQIILWLIVSRKWSTENYIAEKVSNLLLRQLVLFLSITWFDCNVLLQFT